MRLLLAGVAAALALFSWGQAFAHAEPARVKPGDGAVLSVAPTQVEIIMSQDMAREAGQNDIDVFDATDKEVTAVAAVVDNADRRKLSVVLPSSLVRGTYTVKWKTLSADDGDAASGTLSFTFDPARTPQPGREVLREDLLATPGNGVSAPPASLDVGGGSSGTSWVLVVAVAVAAIVVGAGGTFLLVQKRP